MNQHRITRRSVLTATLGAALTGCGIGATPTTSPAPARTAWVDGVLVAATVTAWVLCRGWLTWRRSPAPTR